jgi:hypothetical protein
MDGSHMQRIYRAMMLDSSFIIFLMRSLPMNFLSAPRPMRGGGQTQLTAFIA